jgi:small subunit ribosomal protein S20
MAEQKNGNGEKKAKQRKPSALKRDMQSQRRNIRNRSFKAKVNTAVRSLHETIAKKEAVATKASLSDVYSLMDKGVKKGIFKLNKANRVKSRLHALTKQA